MSRKTGGTVMVSDSPSVRKNYERRMFHLSYKSPVFLRSPHLHRVCLVGSRKEATPDLYIRIPRSHNGYRTEDPSSVYGRF